MGLPLRDTQRHTYGEYLTWTDDRREELIDGLAYVKEPPAPLPIHQGLVAELCRQIGNALQDRTHQVYPAPFDIRLPKSDEADEEIDTVVQPDLFIVRGHKIDRRGMRGAPDWLAEILSPSTARYDQRTKVPVYERAGVPEVWLIHPIARKLTIYRLQDGRYGPPVLQQLKGCTSLTAVPDVSIDWDRVLPRIEGLVL